MMRWCLALLGLLVITIGAPLPICAVELKSQLADVLSAAIHDTVSDKKYYADLYEKYLGIRRNVPQSDCTGRWIEPSQVTPGSTLDRVLKSGVLRIGYWRHDPYYFTDDKGKDAGFELELAEAMIKRINRHYPKSPIKAEWVEQKFSFPGGGQDNVLLYDKLLPGLQQGDFDVAFSGIIVLPARPVVATCPTMGFFWDAIYTGKDNWADVKSAVGVDTAGLVRYLAKKSSVSIFSTAGGPSQETAEKVAAEINAAGGKATTKTATVPELIEAVKAQSAHLMIGDGIAFSSLLMRNHFNAVNLNIAVKDGYVVAPITNPDP